MFFLLFPSTLFYFESLNRTCFLRLVGSGGTEEEAFSFPGCICCCSSVRPSTSLSPFPTPLRSSRSVQPTHGPNRCDRASRRRSWEVSGRVPRRGARPGWVVAAEHHDRATRHCGSEHRCKSRSIRGNRACVPWKGPIIAPFIRFQRLVSYLVPMRPLETL